MPQPGTTTVSRQHATQVAIRRAKADLCSAPRLRTTPSFRPGSRGYGAMALSNGLLGHNVETAGRPSQSPSSHAGCLEPGTGSGRELCPPRATRQQPLCSWPQEPQFCIKFQVRAAHAHQSPPPPRLPSPQHPPGPSPRLLMSRRPPHLEANFSRVPSCSRGVGGKLGLADSCVGLSPARPSRSSNTLHSGAGCCF